MVKGKKKGRVINAKKFFPPTIDDLYSQIATYEKPKFPKVKRKK